MEASESKSYQDIDYEKQFSKDKKFLKNYEYNYETLERDRQRFLEIATRWDCFESQEGKYCLLAAEAYTALNKAAYRQGIIRNYEYYLKLQSSENEINEARIVSKEFKSPHGIIFTTEKHSKEDFDEGKKSHIQEIYFLLAREYMNDNDTDNAFRCISIGSKLYPPNEQLFDFLLYDVYRKANRLPDFLKFTEPLSASRKRALGALIFRASELIKQNYVFKARKKK